MMTFLRGQKMAALTGCLGPQDPLCFIFQGCVDTDTHLPQTPLTGHSVCTRAHTHVCVCGGRGCAQANTQLPQVTVCLLFGLRATFSGAGRLHYTTARKLSQRHLVLPRPTSHMSW